MESIEKDEKSFTGHYRGVVVDNQDPLQAGRVKIRVYPMFRNISDEVLPWAIFSDPFMGGSVNHGGTFIPEIGAHVYVFFEAGDWRYPVYFGGAPAIQDDTPDLPEESRSEESTYPKNRVFRTTQGHLLEFDDSEDNLRIHIYHTTGTEVLIDHDGNMIINVVENEEKTVEGDSTDIYEGNKEISVSGSETKTIQSDAEETTSGNKTLTVSGNFDISVSGNCNVVASGNVVVQGTLINLN